MNTRAWIAIAFGGFVAAPAMSEQPAPLKLIDQYCLGCHDQEHWKGGLALDFMNMQDLGKDAPVWEKVVRKLRTGLMPPAGEPRPDHAGYLALSTYLETQLDAAATAKPNPGRPAAVRRLNRTEYANAIHDLLALDIDADALLPADEAGAGFDNDGRILSVSSMLMERYLIAARQISRTAIGDPTLRSTTMTYTTPEMALQADRQSEALPFGSRGGMSISTVLPLDGEYSVKIRLQRTKGIEGPRIVGLGEPHQLDVRLDGKRVKAFTIGGDDARRPEQIEEGLEVRFPAHAGTRQIGVTFLDEDLAPEGMLRPQLAAVQLKGWGPRDDARRPPGVESVSVSGPLEAKGTAQSPSRRRILNCKPAAPAEEPRCARQILSGLARLAYRRPVTDTDVNLLLRYYTAARAAPPQPGSRPSGRERAFEEGIRAAVEAMLVSPDFLFRVEIDPPKLAQVTHRVSDIDLASRLSFFLWSSIPDATLLDLAESGKLGQPAVLRQQVKRMLADPREKSLVDNFFGQWLGLRSVRTLEPDTITYPDFDDDLRAALMKETDLLLSSMLREDRSVLELLSADYTFVNERLARHYGIANVYGGQFRRVTLRDENRWGIMGKGAVLMVTSLPNRTSPVLRGKWVLDNILGAPPPPPPPDTPAFPEAKSTDITRLTVRARLEQHRVDPKCAVCHTQMDPLGFAFDNFDAIGKWRVAEVQPILESPEMPVLRFPLDPSGVLPDATHIRGPSELRRVLLQNTYNFAYVVSEKMLTYAVGRGLDYYDAPALRKIVRQAAPGNYRWSDLVMGIVDSAPFRMRAPPAKVAPPGQKVAQVAPGAAGGSAAAAAVN